MTIRVVLVDDQEMYRLGFHMLLESQDDVELVGEADDGGARARPRLLLTSRCGLSEHHAV